MSAKVGIASMSSGLALVPLVRCANYCASKAAMHHFVLVLREQLKDTKIKIIEIFPPAVQSMSLLDRDWNLQLTYDSRIARREKSARYQ